MYIELMWIDAKISVWFTASAGGPVTPNLPPGQVKVALTIVHKNAPSWIARYRRQYPKFDELYHFAKMKPPNDKIR